jgi:quercetin dioxygenase-like cupin family protein
VHRPPKPATEKGPADTFSGDVWIDAITRGAPASGLTINAVRFSPGARTAWHRHPGGQTLYVLDGLGVVQARGGAAETLRPGDVVFTADGEEHWHGAAPSHFMTHLSITEAPPVWGAHLADHEYRAATEAGDELASGAP